MDILEVLADDLADSGIICDEVGKAQAPGAPVATHLTNDELALCLRLDDSLIDLFQWVYVLVIYLFESRLGINGDSQ
jgi:hypothetical protein